jgi:hypothetical protein
MCPAIRNSLIIPAFLLAMNFCSAQDNDAPAKENDFAIKQNSNPFRILTSGKQVTIKSSKDIKTIMVWTASGRRIVEKKDVNTGTYNFRINATEKLFFVMLQLSDGKIYSEKIGIQ